MPVALILVKTRYISLQRLDSLGNNNLYVIIQSFTLTGPRISELFLLLLSSINLCAAPTDCLMDKSSANTCCVIAYEFCTNRHYYETWRKRSSGEERKTVEHIVFGEERCPCALIRYLNFKVPRYYLISYDMYDDS